MSLSKSKFVKGLQCHKALWLAKHRAELGAVPDAALQARFDMGHVVGELACGLFPGGHKIEFDANDFAGMIDETRRLIDAGAEVIYEATFSERGVFAMADILVRERGGWAMYEVKSSTGVKPYHLDDAAVQWFALSTVIPLHKAHIVHVNNTYWRKGELDLERLFVAADITVAVEAKQAEIPRLLAAMNAMLDSGEPDIDIGPHCDDPFECDFKAYCWAQVPAPSVFDLYRLPGERKFELYWAGKVALGDLEGENLSSVQALQVSTFLQQKEHVDSRVISRFLDRLEFPLHFFDFETFMEPVPRFDDQRPWSQVPFQYSLHVVAEDGAMEHREFLGDGVADPRREIVERMLADIGPHGSIVAFNAGFERDRIKELAKLFPEHRNELLRFNTRFVDLIEPFRNLGYYHPGFNGSFSLKSIVPAMFTDDPELDYQGLQIQDGKMAMSAYAGLGGVEDSGLREAIRRDLLAYCRVDTLVMVKIWHALKSMAQA